MPVFDSSYRGVVTLAPDVTDAELQQMHDAGMRCARFNFVKRLLDFTSKEELQRTAERIATLSWHVVVYFEAVDLPELWNFFVSLPPDGPQFELFVPLMREHPDVWSKVSCPERLSVTGPKALDGEQNAYRDVVPFARRLIETFSDRVPWGTD